MAFDGNTISCLRLLTKEEAELLKCKLQYNDATRTKCTAREKKKIDNNKISSMSGILIEVGCTLSSVTFDTSSLQRLATTAAVHL